MSEPVVIDCADCETKVLAEVIAEREYGPTEDTDPFKVYFLQCPACQGPIIGVSDLIQLDMERWAFEKPARVWPNPKRRIHYSIPHAVRSSIEEAARCLQAKAYSACVVMCGKALEALCKEHGTTKWQLAQGMKELKNNGVIDGRLFDWGNALRERRNIGAHATGEDVSR